MKLSAKDILKYTILFLLGLLVLYLVFNGQNYDEIFSNIKNANYYWLSLSALIVLLAHWVRALRWQMLIQALGKPIALKHTFYAVMVGYLANLAFPRLGEVTRCGVLNKKVDIGFTPLLGTVITERVIDLLSLLLVIILTVLIQFELIFSYLTQLLAVTKFNVTSIVISFLVILIVVLIGYLLLKKYQNITLIQKIITFLNSLYIGLGSIFVLKNRWLFVFYTFLIWVLYIASVYIAFWVLPDTSLLGAAAAFTVIVFGSLGMIAPVQGGIGAFHFMVTQALKFYQINIATGITLATLLHSSQALIIIVIGFLSLFLILRNKKPDEQT